MRAIFFLCIFFGISINAEAASYGVYKKQIRTDLLKCLNNPENKSTGAVNYCLLQSAGELLSYANKEYDLAFKVADEYNKNSLISDQKIFIQEFINCENFQNLSVGSYSKEATCKFSMARDYLEYLTDPEKSLPGKTFEDWVDNSILPDGK